MAVSRTDYSGRAHQYIHDVLNERIPACKWIKLACERQLRDLENEGSDSFPFWYDETRANHICAFIEKLKHIKGKWAGRPLLLEDWQCFALCIPFGWVDEDGWRRFRTLYGEVPRKNAKSTLSSGVGLYMAFADNEGGAEVYSAATTRDQAKIVWQDAKRMAEKSKGLQKRFGVDTSAKSIFCEETASLFQPLSAEGNSLDGLNVHCAVIDELHAHKTREVFDVLETATGARTQSMLWNITTAGFNLAGICYEQRIYLTKVLEGTVQDETYTGFIYTIDDDDDWTDPNVHAKANPNWGVSVLPDDVARLCKKAVEMPSAQNNFLTKRLNLWCNADTAWMNMRKWNECADPDLKLGDFEGKPGVVALDLSSKVDIAAKGRVFQFTPDGESEPHYAYFGEYYLPEDTVEASENSQYSGWVKTGALTETYGAVIDHAVIKEGVLDDCDRFQVNEVCYDPFNATMLSTALAEEGCTMLEIRPTVQNFSEPMKWLEALVLEKRFHHDGCPVMTWMISNVVCHEDVKGNIYPRKEIRNNKIDGVIALIMGLNRFVNTDEETVTVKKAYQNRGIRTI